MKDNKEGKDRDGGGSQVFFCLGREGHEFNRSRKRGGSQNVLEKNEKSPTPN